MSGKYNKFTVKDLVGYCNKLCEEGHGNAQVVVRFKDDGVEDAELSDCLFDNNHLCLSMDHDLSQHLSEASLTLIEEIVSRHDRNIEIERGLVETYMGEMDDEDKRYLVKQWIKDLL